MTVATDTHITTQITLPGIVAPSGLQVRQVATPVPAAGQVLLRMEASGVSFAEKAMRRGRYPGQPKFPFVPGYDVVGTFSELDPEATAQWWLGVSLRR